MHLLDTEIAPLGMGCWPIGGPFYRGTQPLGYAGAEDGQSIRTIHAALDHGINLFDTAAAYGCGHAERLLARALRDRPDALVVTKIGLRIEEDSKQLVGPDTDPTSVMPALEACLQRLGRDRVDLLLLHLNDLPPTEAAPLFEEMERARAVGKIRAYGWSTDFPDSVTAMAARPGFAAVQHAMNVFHDAPTMTQAARGLTAMIRSPLAMGLLTGKFTVETKLSTDDIRSTDEPWRDYFKGGRPDADLLARLEAVREVLQTGGRSLTQGALCWLWAKGDHILPVPGARTPEQIVGSAGALAHGPLPADAMAEIERLIERPPEGPPRAR